jgi:MFS family permease
LALVLAVLFLPDDREVRRPRELDWLGLVLLSPGLALMLFGAERIRQQGGIVAMIAGVVLLVFFLRVEARKAGRALIDLSQFRNRTFAVAAVVQFLSNGVMFAGQMLIPLFLIEACGRSPAAMGWLLAPLGLGMMVAFPLLGFLTGRFGGRAVATGGALLSLAATLMLVWLASRPLQVATLVSTLFIRGAGLGATALPAMSAAYASVEQRNLPMATTTLNIVQRLGGPTLTTLCALVLAEWLGAQPALAGLNAWEAAFLLLGALHAVMAVAALRLPGRVGGRG